jgi:hypothetical protein
MTDTMTFQNIDLSSWDKLYMIFGYCNNCDSFVSLHLSTCVSQITYFRQRRSQRWSHYHREATLSKSSEIAVSSEHSHRRQILPVWYRLLNDAAPRADIIERRMRTDNIAERCVVAWFSVLTRTSFSQNKPKDSVLRPFEEFALRITLHANTSLTVLDIRTSCISGCNVWGNLLISHFSLQKLCQKQWFLLRLPPPGFYQINSVRASVFPWLV